MTKSISELKLSREQSLESQEVLRRWEKYLETGELVSHKDMLAWLDSWDFDQELPCPAAQLIS